MAETVNNKYRIGKGLFFTMVGFAIIVDIVELILTFTGVGEVLNYILDFIKIVGIPVFFAFKEVPLRTKGLMLKYITTSIIALIPILGSFAPETFYIIWSSIKSARKEDEEKIASGEGVAHNDLKTRLRKTGKTIAKSKAGLKKGKITRQKRGTRSSGGTAKTTNNTPSNRNYSGTKQTKDY